MENPDDEEDDVNFHSSMLQFTDDEEGSDNDEEYIPGECSSMKKSVGHARSSTRWWRWGDLKRFQATGSGTQGDTVVASPFPPDGVGILRDIGASNNEVDCQTFDAGEVCTHAVNKKDNTSEVAIAESGAVCKERPLAQQSSLNILPSVNSSFVTPFNGKVVLGETGDETGCTAEKNDFNAISRRTRAQHSLVDFSLDELEAILQVNEEEDYFTVDDEAEYHKFLDAVKAMGESPDCSSAAVQGNEDAEDDDLDEDDFDFEIDEALLALESEGDEELADVLDPEGGEEEDASADKKKSPATGKRKASRRRESKRLKERKFGFAQRPLRPLVPIPKAASSLCMQKPSATSRAIAPRVMPMLQPIHGFTAKQVGLLHCQIHEHVQLLIQVFSMSVMEPALSTVAAETHRMLDSIVHTRDAILAQKTSAFPDFCFRPPFTQPSKVPLLDQQHVRQARGITGVGFSSPYSCPVYFEGHVPYCGAMFPTPSLPFPPRYPANGCPVVIAETNAASILVFSGAGPGDGNMEEETDGGDGTMGLGSVFRKRKRAQTDGGGPDGEEQDSSDRIVAEAGENLGGCTEVAGRVGSGMDVRQAVEGGDICPSFGVEGDANVEKDGGERGLEALEGWAPKVSGPVRTLLDVAPLALMQDFFADISTVVQAYRQQRLSQEGPLSIPVEDRTPMFAVSAPHHRPLPSTSPSSDCGPSFPESSLNGADETSVVAPPRGGFSRQHPTDAGTAAGMRRAVTGAELKRGCPSVARRGPSRIEGLVVVPHGVARAVARFRGLFDPGLFPCQPPVNENPRRHLFTNAEDQLLAIGIEHFNSDWDKIHKRFLPSKTPKQIKIRVKNRCAKTVPFNCIKAIRQKKDAPLSPEERWAIDMALNQYHNDWHKVWLFAAPTRNPATLQRLWKESRGFQDLWSQSDHRKVRRRALYGERRSVATRPSASAGAIGQDEVQANGPDAAKDASLEVQPEPKSKCAVEAVRVNQESGAVDEDLYNLQELLIDSIDGMAASSAHAGTADQRNIPAEKSSPNVQPSSFAGTALNIHLAEPQQVPPLPSPPNQPPCSPSTPDTTPTTTTIISEVPQADHPPAVEQNPQPPLPPVLIPAGQVSLEPNHLAPLQTPSLQSPVTTSTPTTAAPHNLLPDSPNSALLLQTNARVHPPLPPPVARSRLGRPISLATPLPSRTIAAHTAAASAAPVAPPAIVPAADLPVPPVPKFANFRSESTGAFLPLPAFKMPLPIVAFDSLSPSNRLPSTKCPSSGPPIHQQPPAVSTSTEMSSQPHKPQRTGSGVSPPVGEALQGGSYPRKYMRGGQPKEPRRGVARFRKVTMPTPTTLDLADMPASKMQKPADGVTLSRRHPVELYLNRTPPPRPLAPKPKTRRPPTARAKAGGRGERGADATAVSPRQVAASELATKSQGMAGGEPPTATASESLGQVGGDLGGAILRRGPEQGLGVQGGCIPELGATLISPALSGDHGQAAASEAEDATIHLPSSRCAQLPSTANVVSDVAEVGGFQRGRGEVDNALAGDSRDASGEEHPAASVEPSDGCALLESEGGDDDRAGGEGESYEPAGSAANMIVVMDHEDLPESEDEEEDEENQRVEACENFLGRAGIREEEEDKEWQRPAKDMYVDLRLSLAVPEEEVVCGETDGSEPGSGQGRKMGVTRETDNRRPASEMGFNHRNLHRGKVASTELEMLGGICMEYEELEDSEDEDKSGGRFGEAAKSVDNAGRACATMERSGMCLEAADLAGRSFHRGCGGEDGRTPSGQRERVDDGGSAAREEGWGTYMRGGLGRGDVLGQRQGPVGLGGRQPVVEFEQEEMLDSDEESAGLETQDVGELHSPQRGREFLCLTEEADLAGIQFEEEEMLSDDNADNPPRPVPVPGEVPSTAEVRILGHAQDAPPESTSPTQHTEDKRRRNLRRDVRPPLRFAADSVLSWWTKKPPDKPKRGGEREGAPVERRRGRTDLGQLPDRSRQRLQEGIMGGSSSGGKPVCEESMHLRNGSRRDEGVALQNDLQVGGREGAPEVSSGVGSEGSTAERGMTGALRRSVRQSHIVADGSDRGQAKMGNGALGEGRIKMRQRAVEVERDASVQPSLEIGARRRGGKERRGLDAGRRTGERSGTYELDGARRTTNGVVGNEGVLERAAVDDGNGGKGNGDVNSEAEALAVEEDASQLEAAHALALIMQSKAPLEDAVGLSGGSATVNGALPMS